MRRLAGHGYGWRLHGAVTPIHQEHQDAYKEQAPAAALSRVTGNLWMLWPGNWTNNILAKMFALCLVRMNQIQP